MPWSCSESHFCCDMIDLCADPGGVFGDANRLRRLFWALPGAGVLSSRLFLRCAVRHVLKTFKANDLRTTRRASDGRGALELAEFLPMNRALFAVWSVGQGAPAVVLSRRYSR